MRRGSSRLPLLTLLLPLHLGCQCVSLSQATLYRCEDGGGCFQAAHRCAGAGDPDEGFCAPAGAGGGAAGGAGGTDGGKCAPTRSCIDAPTACSELDDGCGRKLRCDKCPGATFCDAKGACTSRLCGTGGWCWETPFPQGTTLLDAWAAAPDDVWAVGERGTILRYNGKAWASYSIAAQVTFYSIHGRNRDDVYMVGDSATVAHWNGSALILENPNTSASLWGVWVAPHGVVWATGPGVIQRRQLDGLWVNDKPARTDLEYEEPFGSGSDVWAVYGTGVTQRTDGGWRLVPISLTATDRLWNLWGPGDGTLYATGPGGPLAFFDGGQWSVTRPFSGNEISDLWGSGPGDVWAAATNALYHRGSTQWTEVLNTPIGTGDLRAGASVDAGLTVVVGNWGRWAITAPDGAGVTDYVDNIAYGSSIHAIDAEQVVVTSSSGGQWFERTVDAGRPRWEARSCGSIYTGSFQAVWGAPSGKLFATGAGARVIRFTHGVNNVCAVTQAPFDGGVVWGRSGGPIVFAGRGGSAAFADESTGAPLTPISFPPDAGATIPSGLWGDSSGQFWAATRSGTSGGLWKLADLGVGWTSYLPPTAGGALRAIHGSHSGNSTEALAVGDNGQALLASSVWPDPTFGAQLGVTESLRGVYVVQPGLAWAVGQNGTTYRWSSGWSAVETPIGSLAAVTGAPDAGVWALGAGSWDGTILWHP